MFASRHTAEFSLGRMTRRSTTTGLLGHLRLAMIAHAQRRQLARLDDAGLADIGLTRADAAIEAARPVWDVPANWRR